MSIFDKWNEKMDVEEIRNNLKEVEKNNGTGEYKEVPEGKYEVKVEKLEIKPSKKGDPMLFAQFRILEGEYKNSCLFWNQVITQSFQIAKANYFLRDLDTGVEVDFKDYKQYNDLVLDMKEKLDKEQLEYLIEFFKKDGFANYKIKEVYDQE